MIKPHLIFTKYKNSFSVHISNMEKLSVVQIQKIEYFVSARKGIFNFETYTFEIQKKIDFPEFISLLNHVGLDSHCEENVIISRFQPRVGFGQYKGMQYNELPDSYMLWLKANYRGADRDIIDKELKKRNL